MQLTWLFLAFFKFIPFCRLASVLSTDHSNGVINSPGKRICLTFEIRCDKCFSRFSRLAQWEFPLAPGIPSTCHNCPINRDTVLIVGISQHFTRRPVCRQQAARCWWRRAQLSPSRIIALFQKMFLLPWRRFPAVSEVIWKINCCWDVCSQFWVSWTQLFQS